MPWFLFALVGVLAVAALIALMPKPKIENARSSELGDFQFPRSEEGDPWPLIYGKVKIKGPNTLWYGDFSAKPIVVRGPRRYGLFGPRSSTITGYRYFIGMDLGLCLGPGVALRRIWAGSDEAWSGNVSGDGESFSISKRNLYGNNNAGGGISGTCRFYPGTNRQAVDSYVASHTDGADTTRYPMMCHIVFQSFYVGTSTAIKPFFFELERYPNTLGIPDGKHRVGDDCNLVEILYDLLTNRFARRGTPPSKINLTNWRTIAVQLADEGNVGSFRIESSNTGKDVVQEILRQMDAIMYTDPATGLIELRLIRNDYDRNTLPHYNEDEIIKVRNYSKPSWEETVNQLRVKFVDRTADYTSRTVMDQDMANINTQQQVRATEMEFTACYSGALAQALCGRELSLISVPFTKAELEFTREVNQMRPGDVFRYSYAEYGIVDEVVRIQGFDLGTLEEGTITAIVVQDRFVYGDSSAIVPPSNVWTPPTFPPADSGALLVTRAPLWFNLQLQDPDVNNAYLLFFAERPASAWTYAYRLSTGGAVIEENKPFSTVGVLGVSMPATATTIGSLALSTMPSGLVTKTDTDIRNGMNLALIGTEFVGFRSQSGSNLTTVYRGLFGSTPVSHSSGDEIHFLGEGGEIESLLETAFLAGQSYTFTVTTQTIFGFLNSADQTITYTPPTITNKPREPFTLLINGVATAETNVPTASSMTLGFSSSDRLDKYILLPGDTVPPAPFGTTYRARIIRASDSAIVFDQTWSDTSTRTITAPATLGVYTFEMRASLGGIESNLTTLSFNIV